MAIFRRRGQKSDNSLESPQMWLQGKIVLQASLVALLLLILGASAAWYVLRLQNQHSKILDVNVASIRAAEEMEIIIREVRYELEQFRLTQDLSRLEQALRRKQDLESWVAQARALSGSESEEAFVAQIQRGLDDFFLQLGQEIETFRDSGSANNIQRLVRDALTQQVLPNAHQYLDLNEQELQNSNEQSKAMAERLALALLLLGTCGAIAGLVAGYGAARGISRSVLQLSLPIRDVAGKLDQVVGPIDITADPSFADLETVLLTMSTKVGAVVDQLQARHREVIRADQLAAVGQLAAGLAHELRNPLMCMKTLVQSSRRRSQDAHLDAEDVRILDEEITRLDKLLQAFLDFARPARLETKKVDLADVVRQTVKFLSKKAEVRGIAIECRLPERPLPVEVDATQLRQVLLNLLLNALDAVDSGGTIWVDAMPAGKTRRHLNEDSLSHTGVCLRVSDNGPGLPPDERDRIFEPFFSTKDTGLGLGLAISHRIIDAHGGQLVAFDRDGGGAVFEIQLPAQGSVRPTKT